MKKPADIHLKVHQQILPPEALSQHVAILGKTGSGKTYAAKAIVEGLLEANRRVCIIDPTGAWWGLKSSADGKCAGYPVVVFGGDHADVPITEHAGAALGELVARENMPSVIDLSGTLLAERQRFMVAFAQSLYRSNKAPLHLIVDEADEFSPQGRSMDKNPLTSMLVGAMDRIVRRGRVKGFRVTMITQRPAVLNKNVLTQAGTLIALRLPAPQDRTAVEDWIHGQADDDQAADVLGSLSKLQRGEGWVWFPEGGVLKRVMFPKIKTFDSGRTPEEGGQIEAPKKIADVDLASINAALAEATKEAAANDPKLLRQRIEQLEREVKTKAPAAHDAAAIARQVQRAEAERDKFWQKEIEGIRRRQVQLTKLPGLLRDAATTVEAGIVALNGHAAQVVAPGPTMPVVPRQTKATVANHSRAASTPHADTGLTPRQQRFLDAAASLAALGSECTRETVSAWIGVHPRGGSVGEELKSLEVAGMITIDRGRITVTDAGQSAANHVDPIVAIDSAKSGLSNRQRQFFELIEQAYPGEISREEIAAACNLHPRGGSLGEDLGRLVGRGLVDNNRGRYRARDFLYAKSV